MLAIRAKSDSTLSQRQSQRYRVVAVWTQERKLQRQKERPLPLLTAPLVISLLGTLRVQKKRRQKKRSSREGGQEHAPRRAHMGSFSDFHIFPWVQERAVFLSNYPMSFWLFQACACALCYPISYLDSLRFVPFPNPILLSHLSRLVPSPLCAHHFGSYCT